MRQRCAVSLMAVLMAATAACQTAATPLPTSTPQPPTATTTSVPPTSTPTEAPPTETPRPTSSPAPTPTRTATALPPIPTANFAAADIFKTWFRSDPDRGNLYLTLSDAGTYDAAHGTLEGTVHHGQFTLEGRLLTIVDGWNCAPAESTPGQYVLRQQGGGQWLYLDVYLDTCPDRPESLSGFRWDRYVAP